MENLITIEFLRIFVRNMDRLRIGSKSYINSGIKLPEAIWIKQTDGLIEILGRKWERTADINAFCASNGPTSGFDMSFENHNKVFELLLSLDCEKRLIDKNGILQARMPRFDPKTMMFIRSE